MENDLLVRKTEAFIRSVFHTEGSGHDWWHIHRVRHLALKIALEEGADVFIVEMAALLHDLDDWKLAEKGDPMNGKAQKWLVELGLNEDICRRIIAIIDEVSFKGAGVETKATTIESKAVQDADRLDAIGAIGIARTFAYGGHKNRLIYDPEISPVEHQSFEAYKKGDAPTINHFYEKLLLLKDRMNTDSAKIIAEKRHDFMIHFLNQFYNEWDCIS